MGVRMLSWLAKCAMVPLVGALTVDAVSGRWHGAMGQGFVSLGLAFGCWGGLTMLPRACTSVSTPTQRYRVESHEERCGLRHVGTDSLLLLREGDGLDIHRIVTVANSSLATPEHRDWEENASPPYAPVITRQTVPLRPGRYHGHPCS